MPQQESLLSRRVALTTGATVAATALTGKVAFSAEDVKREKSKKSLMVDSTVKVKELHDYLYARAKEARTAARDASMENIEVTVQLDKLLSLLLTEEELGSIVLSNDYDYRLYDDDNTTTGDGPHAHDH